MAKIIGYGFLAVVGAMALFSSLRIWSLMVLAASGLQRPGDVMELTTLICCGVVILAVGAVLLLKKKASDRSIAE